jgi:1,4-alpha-glucan branching enzyme
VVFIFDQQSAQEVLLAGSFTNWNEAPIRMRRDGNGAWQTRVLLAPGRYFYKYLVDGQWHTDPEAPEDCPNPFGTTDSVKEIT